MLSCELSIGGRHAAPIMLVPWGPLDTIDLFLHVAGSARNKATGGSVRAATDAGFIRRQIYLSNSSEVDGDRLHIAMGVVSGSDGFCAADSQQRGEASRNP